MANGIAVTLTGGVTLSGAQAGDYSVGLPNSPLTANITVRTLTVTPDAVSIAFSGVPLNNTTYSDNTGNYTYVGFQNGQNASTAGVSFSGSMAFNGSTATTVEAVGTYLQAVGTLSMSSANNNYQMSFSNPTPNDYVITPGAPSVIEFVQGPSSVQSATTMTPAVTVEVTDSFGNPVSGQSVTLILNSGTGTLTGGGAQTTAANGIATFSGLSVNLIGLKTLKATSGALSVVSGSFTVTLGPIASYSVTTFPTAPVRLATFNVTVTALDAGGNTVTTDNSTVVTVTDSTGNMDFTGSPVTLSSGTFTITASDDFSETDIITATDPNNKTGNDNVTINPATGDYRSQATGTWATAATWQTWNGSSLGHGEYRTP